MRNTYVLLLLFLRYESQRNVKHREKEWVAQRDGVVRDSHRLADGQRVQKNGFFNVGGYNMLYPADSSGGAPAGQIINCRCSLIYHEVL